MARLARAVAPGIPHHVTQRGNRRQRTFFSQEDYEAYIELMATWCCQWEVEVWAYCLMPNHVHLIVVPSTVDGLRRAIGEAHRRYTRRVNFRKGWRGHLWQGRFASFVMDEPHLLTAVRYVEQNPVEARMVKRAEDHRWSSAAAHIAGKDDPLVRVRPLLERVGDWRTFLSEGVDSEARAIFDRHEATGRPLGSEVFVGELERKLGRVLKPQKRGPRPKAGDGRPE